MCAPVFLDRLLYHATMFLGSSIPNALSLAPPDETWIRPRYGQLSINGDDPLPPPRENGNTPHLFHHLPLLQLILILRIDDAAHEPSNGGLERALDVSTIATRDTRDETFLSYGNGELSREGGEEMG